MRETLKKIDGIVSWILLIAMSVLLISSLVTVNNARKTGEPAFIMGFRPILIFTGSMEPYLKTNGMALTREVTSLDQLEPGDVISYHIEDETGKMLRITHRIQNIDSDGVITTKGDNNKVEDSYPLGISNVESKVVFTMNFMAGIITMMQSPQGRFVLCSLIAAVILAYVSVKLFIQDCRRKKLEKELLKPDFSKEENSENQY